MKTLSELKIIKDKARAVWGKADTALVRADARHAKALAALDKAEAAFTRAKRTRSKGR